MKTWSYGINSLREEWGTLLRKCFTLVQEADWDLRRIVGCLLRNKKEWVYSCYDKLAGDLFFDPQITQITPVKYATPLLNTPQYDFPNLPQYHLPELRGRRGQLCCHSVNLTW